MLSTYNTNISISGTSKEGTIELASLSASYNQDDYANINVNINGIDLDADQATILKADVNDFIDRVLLLGDEI